MVCAKRSLNVKVDLPFDDYCAYFCIYAFQPSPNAYWDGNLGLQVTTPKQVLLLLVQIFTMTRPHASSTRTSYVGILLFAAPRKEYHIGGLAITFSELPFKI